MFNTDFMSEALTRHPFQSAVAEFHRACGLTVGETPGLRDRELRASLIAEEAREVAEALESGDLSHSVAELCDLYYVVYGSAVTFGLTLIPSPPSPIAESVALRNGKEWAIRMRGLGDTAAENIRTYGLSIVQANLEYLVRAVDECFAVFGLEPTLFFAAIHAANMLKASGPRRADGKILKPVGWQPADITGLLRAAEATAS